MKFDEIHNYYETLVIRRIMEDLVVPGGTPDEDYFGDVACVALNQLPARYVRHEVDLAFYMPMEERLEMERAVTRAVHTAAKYVNEHRSTDNRPETITVEQA